MNDLTLAPFLAFCVIATVTPGPNNMINLAQGVRLGFWRAMPFAIGTGIGVGSLLCTVILGLGAAITASPLVAEIMRVATIGYLLYLAWNIAMSGPIDGEGRLSALGFWGGVGFQWINPKTWASAMAMATTYLPPHPSLGAAGLAANVFCVVAWAMQPVWIGFGSALRGWLQNARIALLVNVVMAILLLATTLPFLLARYR